MKNLKFEQTSLKKNRSFFMLLLAGLVVVFSQSAVAAKPKITKSFNPTSIAANEFATLTIEFINPNASAAKFTAPFSENLPNGMVILGSSSTSCGGSLTAEAGSSKLTLADAKIPAYGACYILVGVTATRAGSFESKTLVADLQTDKGSNSIMSDATLTVTPPVSTLIKRSGQQTELKSP